MCVELLEMEVGSIRHTTEIIGYLVAAHPGVWVCSCFVKNGDCLNAALSETVVILMLS